jgi:hypothetical protein
MTKKFRLIVTQGIQAGQVWEGCPERFSIGSAPSCELILIDCAPNAIAQIILRENTVVLRGVGTPDQSFPFDETISVNENCAIKIQKCPSNIGIAINEISTMSPRLEKLFSSSGRLRIEPKIIFGAFASFLLTAALASEFWSSTKGEGRPVQARKETTNSTIERVLPVVSFEQNRVHEKPFTNGDLEKRFGCKKECFDRNQVAALISGDFGSIHLKDGRKFGVGSVVSDSLIVSAIGETYVVFTRDDDSIRIDLN